MAPGSGVAQAAGECSRRSLIEMAALDDGGARATRALAPH